MAKYENEALREIILWPYNILCGLLPGVVDATTGRSRCYYRA
jgi:hypothetical protein